MANGFAGNYCCSMPCQDGQYVRPRCENTETWNYESLPHVFDLLPNGHPALIVWFYSRHERTERLAAALKVPWPGTTLLVQADFKNVSASGSTSLSVNAVILARRICSNCSAITCPPGLNMSSFRLSQLRTSAQAMRKLRVKTLVTIFSQPRGKRATATGSTALQSLKPQRQRRTGQLSKGESICIQCLLASAGSRYESV